MYVWTLTTSISLKPYILSKIIWTLKELYCILIVKCHCDLVIQISGQNSITLKYKDDDTHKVKRSTSL